MKILDLAIAGCKPMANQLNWDVALELVVIELQGQQIWNCANHHKKTEIINVIYRQIINIIIVVN